MTDEVTVATSAENVKSSNTKPRLGEPSNDSTWFETLAPNFLVG